MRGPFEEILYQIRILLAGSVYGVGLLMYRALIWRNMTGLYVFIAIGVGINVVELVSAAIEPPMPPWERAVKEGRSYVPPIGQ